MSNLFQAATNGDPAYHALIVGVSRYTHLTGGAGPLTEEPLAAQLDQLGAAATSAVRVAMWIRDHFEHPTAGKGSIRLLVSPSAGETPLPEDIEAPPATHANVSAAVTEWRRDVRANDENVAVLYIAGHGLQTSNEGGILLLEDFGSPDAPTPLHAAIDVESVRRGIVSDPNRPNTATPKLQFYFYDACRINPAATAGDAHSDVLIAGIDQLVGKGNVLEVDVFKLPHHGSKANVTRELLSRVRAHTYVFSTDGSGNQRHPNDQAVARVIKYGGPSPVLAFNYRSVRNKDWDSDSLRSEHGYRTEYPPVNTEGISIDLLAIPR